MFWEKIAISCFVMGLIVLGIWTAQNTHTVIPSNHSNMIWKLNKFTGNLSFCSVSGCKVVADSERKNWLEEYPVVDDEIVGTGEGTEIESALDSGPFKDLIPQEKMLTFEVVNIKNLLLYSLERSLINLVPLIIGMTVLHHLYRSASFRWLFVGMGGAVGATISYSIFDAVGRHMYAFELIAITLTSGFIAIILWFLTLRVKISIGKILGS